MVAIVVVHWNTPELLARCLESIASADSPSVGEIVVVDCDSPDGDHIEIVARFSGVQLVQMEMNSGYAAGCNAGTNATTCEKILYLNADTCVLPGSADAIDACFELSSRIGLVAPLLLNENGSVQSAGYRYPGIANIIAELWPVPDRLRGSRLNGRLDAGNRFHPYAIDYPLGAAIAVRRVALEEVGGWDESYGMYCEEIDLARKLDESGWRRLIEPRAAITHVGGASTEQRPVEMQAALWQSRGMYHGKWDSYWRVLLLRAAVMLDTWPRADLWNNAIVRDAFRAGLTL